MTSHFMGDCCVRGAKHEGKPRGEIKKLGGVDSYFVYPENKSTENCVLYLADVFGHEPVNAQLLADGYADNGYFCVIPDLFGGDPYATDKGDVWDWVKLPPSKGPDRIDGVVAEVIKDLRSNHKVKKIGAVGYCFGAKYVARFTGETGKNLSTEADAGYMAHPSFVTADELKALTKPLAIAAAETDSIFPTDKRHESEEILKELAQGSLKLPYQINLYSAVEHGFAVRGDLSDRRVKFAKEQAFNQAVEWFNYFLKEGGH